MARLTDTISGAIATFRTPGKQDIRSLKVHFAPVQEGTGDPSPENVRPISGWTGVTAYSAGANLLPEELLVDFDNYSNRGSYGYFYTDPIQLAPNTTYHLGWTRITEDSDPLCYWGVKSYSGAGYDVADAGTFQYYCNGANGFKAYTSFNSGETGKIRFALNKNSSQYATAQDALDDLFAKAKFTLNAGTTASEYEPYKEPTTLPLDWTDSAGTVYSGYVDLVTGEVWETWTVVDMGQIEWLKSSSGNKFYVIGLNRNYPWQSDLTMYCPIYKFDGANVGPTYYGDDCTIRYYYKESGSQSREIYVHDERFDNAADFKTAMDGVPLVYPLATPILLTTLTPTALKTLIGTNNIWSNANGNVDVEYDFAESREMMEARKRVATFKWKPSRLPAGYKEVEYLERRSAAEGQTWPYIQTPARARLVNNTKAEITFYVDCAEAFVFGCRQSTSVNMFNINRPSAEGAIRVDIGSISGGVSKVNYFNHSDTGTYTVHMEYFSASVKRHSDGSVISSNYSNSGGEATGLYIHLFGVATNGSVSAKITNGIVRIMNAKIWEGDPSVLAYDFVPCIRKSDNKAGMYDLVNNVFYLPTYGKFFTNLD